jgi:hypothetical protein
MQNSAAAYASTYLNLRNVFFVQQFLHCCVNLFKAQLLSNGSRFLFHYSGFQQSFHSIIMYLTKQIVRVRSGLIWLRVTTCGGFL